MVIGRFALSLSIVIHFLLFVYASLALRILGLGTLTWCGGALCRFDVLLRVSGAMSPLIYLYAVVACCQLYVAFLPGLW
jgi:hypothetical protein